MPIELQIIRASEFVRLGPRGKFDLKASKAALAELAGACRKRGINQALMDLRALQPGAKPVFSPNDLAVLVNTFREMGFTQRQRLAVLYRSDPHHRVRLFAFIAKLRGWSVQAFDDFEKALAWLSGAGLDQPGVETEHTPQPKPVPVRTRASVEAAAISAVPPVIPIDSKPARGGIPSKKGAHHFAAETPKRGSNVKRLRRFVPGGDFYGRGAAGFCRRMFHTAAHTGNARHAFEFRFPRRQGRDSRTAGALENVAAGENRGGASRRQDLVCIS